jgi:lipopolysaccharide biosynthesis glycosyltransferase
VQKKGTDMNVCFVYVTDRQGFDLATLSALSLGMSQPAPCHIRIFCHKFDPQPSKDMSEAVAKLGIDLSFSPVEDAAAEQHQTHGHVTTPTLLKLRAVETLVSDYDRVVFLDNDILVFKDLKIDKLDFGTSPIAAVADMDLADTGVLRNSDWRNDPRQAADVGSYFNAGFLVFEASNWHNDFLAAYEIALDRHDHGCPYKINCTSIDQCALNVVFEDDWLRLSPTYNMQASSKFTESWKTAAVRHYCGPRKYVPLSFFRSDKRDVDYLNAINRLLGRPTSNLAPMYELFHALNRIRNHRNSGPIRDLLHVLESQHNPATYPRQPSGEARQLAQG